MTHRFLCLIPVAALTLPGAAAAEWRCDCTTITDSCSAEVSLADEFVEVTTDTDRCARVDYFIDGRPFVAVVTEGRQRQDWIPGSGEPNVLVQSCQVCRDNADAAVRARDQGSAEAATGEGTLEPLIEITPTYPEAARARGASGFVEVRFTVLPSGEVDDVSVTESEPAGVFDAAAVAAVRRWRYAADPEREPVELSERLEFTPPPAAAAASRPAPQAAAAAAQSEPTAAGPRNRCLREDAVYNYGEMVEVGLIDACTAPLAVYVCAEGVGPRQGRWHCTGAHDQRRLLVPQNDARIGDSVVSRTPDGLASFEYVGAFFVTRAPNTEYWWLACGVDDAACRARARDWTRAVDGQLARIDPELRTSARVSRSY